MRRRVVLVVLLSLLLFVAGFVSADTPLSREALAETVAALTAPDMEGRRSGTPGGDRAAAYLADSLKKAGCASFLQSFVITAGTRLAATNAFDIPSRPSPAVSTDWVPHAGSSNGDVTAEVVFVGYGISAPEDNYDDYAGVDVKGRIALAFTGNPSRLGHRVTRVEKIVAARERGAHALLLIEDPLPLPAAAPATSPILTASVRRSAADALLPAGTTVASLESSPRSLATGTTVRLRIALEPTDVRGANVLCVVPGTDPALADETVVVGAHYDHLGLVDGVVHPGADDNASGTAVVVALARAFLAAGGAPRTLVFVLFGGEEVGLVGSRYYVNHPARPIARTVAMVNLDMVGRLSAGKLTVGGVDSAVGLGDTVRAAFAAESMTASLTGSPFGPSDHASFYRAGVPALFLHTGGHSDYHRATDTADKLDIPGMTRVAAMAKRVVEALASSPRPVYATVRPPSLRTRTGGAQAFLGVQSDGSGVDGARLMSVLPGSAAERAGLREGDVVIRLAGTPLASFDDLRAAIRTRAAGDRVDVVYVRNGERFSVSATLGGPNE